MANTIVMQDSLETAYSPITNLRCYLDLTSIADEYAKKHGVNFTEQEKQLCCILNAIPTITYNTTWKEGATASLSEPIDTVSEKLGSVLKTLAGDTYTDMQHTGIYSQYWMESASVISVDLSFRIYADSFNARYTRGCSTFEDWLRVLTKAVSPIRPFDINTLANNINAAVTAVTNENSPLRDKTDKLINQSIETLKLANATINPFSDDDVKLKDGAPQILKDVVGIAAEVENLLNAGRIYSGLTFKLGIGKQFLSEDKNVKNEQGNTTIQMLNDVPWVITSFTATPSVNFLPSTRGPKPIYVDFTVKVETNEVLDQVGLCRVLALDQNARIAKALTTIQANREKAQRELNAAINNNRLLNDQP